MLAASGEAASPAGLLASLGVPPEEAARIAGPNRGGEEAVAAQAAQAESVCRLLVEEGGVRVRDLAVVLGKCPALLRTQPGQLAARLSELKAACSLAGGRRGGAPQLGWVVRAAPELLAAEGGLRERLAALAATGLGEAGVHEACRACPLLLAYSADCARGVLESTGLDPASDPEAAAFVTSHAGLIFADGGERARAALGELRSCGLGRREALRVLTQLPVLLRTPVERMELVAEVLRSFAMTRPQLAAVVRGYPGVLRKE